ncbi:hypothetical protein C9374_009354 [Naegleria lovaniensis]|uniref:RGS domain-containing protein n=1 Tax=Naegleria lovaniensis TaxID=51637 RepID=A0AA88KH45_NAELO|nr:uncharacterized protein C9374_009354 [Naegleria lovaniensis]KAG2377443.1 hypothetical protein C9374_009354 [Naegleria lovaniensis]
MKQLSDQELLLYFTKFKREIKPKDHTCLFTTYKDCFSGKEAIRVLSSLFNLNTSDAMNLGNQMILKKLFIHSIHESTELLDKKKEFYRFTNFRRCSKRLSILDMSQFTSNLDENYRKLIEEERQKNERIGDIRILLDDVYQAEHSGSSSSINNHNNNFTSGSPRGGINNHSSSSNIAADDNDSSSSSSDNSSPLSSLAKKFSLPLKMKKSPSIPSSLASSSPPLMSGLKATEDLACDTKNASPMTCKAGRSPSAHDLELKLSLEDVDIYMERFASIDDVLKHPKACTILTQFAVDEYAEESIFFWKEWKAYRKEARMSKKVEMAVNIFNVYVNPEGPLALNINKKLIDECRKTYLNADDDCFDDIGKEVKRILTDLFERLKLGLQKQKNQELNLINSKNLSSTDLVV